MAKHKMKLPKRIAGIKIPKVIRKGALGHFLNSNAGQLVVAETLTALAAAFTASKVDDMSVGENLRHPVKGGRRVGHLLAAAGSDQSERLTHAFRQAGKAFHDALHEADEAVWHSEREEHAKKKSSGRASSATRH